jgi:acetylornithine deacetylase
MKEDIRKLKENAIKLLKDLIAIPSYSSEEGETATLLEGWFVSRGIPHLRTNNNVYAFNKHFDKKKPTLLLNSHHDTVRPNTAYTRDPFKPSVEDGKLYGLGSNDAGGALVSLIATFTHFYEKERLSHNLVVVASAEEESSGPKGLNSMLEILPPIDVAIVGEPTLMQLAIAEKGLVVFDAQVAGTPSHAAHPNTDNPIYNCIEVLQWFRDFRFPKVSEVLGEVKLTVTQINGGSQHNVVPASVALVIDVRVNDKYTNEEVARILQEQAPCKLLPRSLHLNSSSIPKDHLLVRSGIALGRETYGSPTLSDQATLSCPSLKLGPGDSRRSHSANEYISVGEIEEGISLYIELLNGFLLEKSQNL